MKTLIFCTNNPNKLREAREILKEYRVTGKKIKITEIQGSSKEIVREKAQTAFSILKKSLFVEDTALHIDALNGLPGPYIKTFLKKLGANGIFKLVSGFPNRNASAVTTLAYIDRNTLRLFEGEVRGRIVKPRGVSKFGFDPIFQPDSFSLTYAELGARKNEISHRRKALQKLRSYLGRLR